MQRALSLTLHPRPFAGIIGRDEPAILGRLS
jgi:hypothetical protein